MGFFSKFEKNNLFYNLGNGLKSFVIFCIPGFGIQILGFNHFGSTMVKDRNFQIRNFPKMRG